METNEKGSAAQVLLRIPTTLKNTLQLEANKKMISLTAEIRTRLEQSLEEHPSQSIFKNTISNNRNIAQETTPTSYRSSNTEQAMLEVFRRLPPEKQLALLSLFK